MTDPGQGAVLLNNLQPFLTTVLTLSIASERLVEVIKGFIPFLRTELSDASAEAKRRASLHVLSILAGVLTAFLTSSAFDDLLAPVGSTPLAIIALGLLASGGSGFWNAILSWVLQAKNLKKEEVAGVRAQNAASPANETEGVYGNLAIGNEQVSSNACYDVGE
ncbi:hypothetical protein [Novosphingobium cyanobacteriorum]|uniref:Holin n=1 Tax=Novosphingobium cyanobacteriorum TaxID=3024215 RepID=A0ABT6CGK5_9SPHN|nr:hypothetical protein [Novosphingobium cyanobacteriorum]MDF8332603.1 hypothetical protein [Novosphingobium cyanobacteriorum]